MPRERIPENEFFWRQLKPQQCAPDDRGGRLGKTFQTFLTFARPLRSNSQKNAFWRDASFSSKQKPFGCHRYSAEMTAAVTKRFPDDRESRLSQPITKISAQLFSPNAWSLWTDIVFLVNLPPRHLKSLLASVAFLIIARTFQPNGRAPSAHASLATLSCSALVICWCGFSPRPSRFSSRTSSGLPKTTRIERSRGKNFPGGRASCVP